MPPLRIWYIVALKDILKVTQFKILLSGKLWRGAKKCWQKFYNGWYSPSNESFANVVLRDMHLNICELVKVGANMCNKSYRFWYMPSNYTITDVVLNNFGLNFQGQGFSCYVFAIKNCAITVDGLSRFSSTRIPTVMLLWFINLRVRFKYFAPSKKSNCSLNQ